MSNSQIPFFGQSGNNKYESHDQETRNVLNILDQFDEELPSSLANSSNDRNNLSNLNDNGPSQEKPELHHSIVHTPIGANERMFHSL